MASRVDGREERGRDQGQAGGLGREEVDRGRSLIDVGAQVAQHALGLHVLGLGRREPGPGRERG